MRQTTDAKMVKPCDPPQTPHSGHSVHCGDGMMATEGHPWYVCSKVTGKAGDPASAAGIREEPLQLQASKAPLLFYCLPEIQMYESPRGFESLRQSTSHPSPFPLHHTALFLQAKFTDAGRSIIPLLGGAWAKKSKEGKGRDKVSIAHKGWKARDTKLKTV